LCSCGPHPSPSTSFHLKSKYLSLRVVYFVGGWVDIEHVLGVKIRVFAGFRLRVLVKPCDLYSGCIFNLCVISSNADSGSDEF
jgi:hypothetical protein